MANLTNANSAGPYRRCVIPSGDADHVCSHEHDAAAVIIG
nr:hypothetical protein SAMN05192547_101349 [Paraburkholderia sediminicola]